MFPFTVYAVETPQYTSSAREFYQAFQEVRPAHESYYCYDTVVKSPTEVEFIAHGMRDNYYGGIGGQVFRCSATIDRAITRKAIERQALKLARERRDQELRDDERRIVENYAAEILAEAMKEAA